VVQWLTIHLGKQKMQVQPLVWELRSHMPCDMTKMFKKSVTQRRNTDSEALPQLLTIHFPVCTNPSCRRQNASSLERDSKIRTSGMAEAGMSVELKKMLE